MEKLSFDLVSRIADADNYIGLADCARGSKEKGAIKREGKVAQISQFAVSLTFRLRGAPKRRFGATPASRQVLERPSACGLEIRDTADWKSALRASAGQRRL